MKIYHVVSCFLFVSIVTCYFSCFLSFLGVTDHVLVPFYFSIDYLYLFSLRICPHVYNTHLRNLSSPSNDAT